MSASIIDDGAEAVAHLLAASNKLKKISPDVSDQLMVVAGIVNDSMLVLYDQAEVRGKVNKEQIAINDANSKVIEEFRARVFDNE